MAAHRAFIWPRFGANRPGAELGGANLVQAMNAKKRGAAASLFIGAAIAAAWLAPAHADRIKHPTAMFEGLDKITGRVISFEGAIDETVQFGSPQITPPRGYTRPPPQR